jgi:Flp pilus assembly pilin Flp
MKNLFVRFIREDGGQDVIEYGMLAAFISVVAGALIVGIGGDVVTMFTTVDAALVPGGGGGAP